MYGLTFEAHYALAALTSMASRPERSVSRMREISAREGIPAPFLSKILLKLRHAGIIRSRHGRGGGYALARPAFDITVKEVLAACREESLAFDLASPPIASNVALASGLRGINAGIDRVLDGTSIGDLAGIASPPATVHGVELAAAV